MAVCEMQRTKSGVFTRSNNPFVEMEAYRSDSYSAFVKRAAHKCRLCGQKNKFVSLFKLNGARVLDEDVILNDKARPWTLGRYLLLIKKAPSNVKMRVGYLSVSKVPSCLYL